MIRDRIVSQARAVRDPILTKVRAPSYRRHRVGREHFDKNPAKTSNNAVPEQKQEEEVRRRRAIFDITSLPIA
jgi:hypothetical protein